MLGEGFAFDIEIRKGGGAYIYSEETAIFDPIEVSRGQPRYQAELPGGGGPVRQATVVDDVETLVDVCHHPREQPGYAETGAEGSTGTKLFCLSGNVERPGVTEVPFGTTLSESAGTGRRRRSRARSPGRAHGRCRGRLPAADELDLPLTFEGAREAKTTLGSGVVLVLDDRVDLPRFLQRIAAFFRNESCGQCVPCRVGTVRQQEALARLVSGRTRGGAEAELALVGEIGQCMRDASICGLGQTASSAIESAIGRLGVFGGAK